MSRQVDVIDMSCFLDSSRYFCCSAESASAKLPSRPRLTSTPSKPRRFPSSSASGLDARCRFQSGTPIFTKEAFLARSGAEANAAVAMPPLVTARKLLRERLMGFSSFYNYLRRSAALHSPFLIRNSPFPTVTNSSAGGPSDACAIENAGVTEEGQDRWRPDCLPHDGSCACPE